MAPRALAFTSLCSVKARTLFVIWLALLAVRVQPELVIIEEVEIKRGKSWLPGPDSNQRQGG